MTSSPIALDRPFVIDAHRLVIGITGGSGVLGRRLREVLNFRGHQVVTLDEDVRAEEAVGRFVAQVDMVLHCAAIVPVNLVEKNLARAAHVNVLGTVNVGRACRTHKKRLVYISSSHVYKTSRSPLKETDMLEGRTAYSLTKLQGEEWAQLLTPNGLILRLFSYFDAEQADSYVVPSLYARIRDAPPGGRVNLLGACDVRDMADARWMANVVARVSVSDATGPINCGTGQGIRIRDLAESIKDVTARQDVEIDGIATGDAPTILVADTRRLTGVLGGVVPEFDLNAALRNFRADRGRG